MTGLEVFAWVYGVWLALMIACGLKLKIDKVRLQRLAKHAGDDGRN
jgi:hypothetical protein